MSENDLVPINFQNLAKEVQEIPSGWDAETGFRIVLQIIPYVGGALEKILFANKDKKEKKQLAYFIYLLAVQLEKIDKNKLDESYLESDEFYVLIKRTFEKIRFEAQQEKILLFRNFILNSALKKTNSRVDFSKEYMLNKLDNLTLEHFQILDWYFKNNLLNAPKNNSESQKKKQTELPKISKHWEVYEIDLASAGLFSRESGARFSLNPVYWPSELGKQFYHFIQYAEDN
ncbi:MAG: hypothetical protein NUV57_04685 [archaeon]|nr:hypothetical protein [archaeon]